MCVCICLAQTVNALDPLLLITNHEIVFFRLPESESRLRIQVSFTEFICHGHSPFLPFLIYSHAFNLYRKCFVLWPHERGFYIFNFSFHTWSKKTPSSRSVCDCNSLHSIDFCSVKHRPRHLHCKFVCEMICKYNFMQNIMIGKKYRKKFQTYSLRLTGKRGKTRAFVYKTYQF